MRTLEQCKAEVFRRSNEKIKQRRIILSCALAACIPAVLCVGMWSFFILPAMMPASMEDAAAPEAEMIYDTATNASANLSAQSYAATVHTINNGEFSLSAADTDEVLKILVGLDYNPAKLCKCLPTYRIETEFGSYGVHLTEGYARCDQGQAALTEEQIKALRSILES